MAHTNYPSERRENTFLPIRKFSCNALQAVRAWQYPALRETYPIQPNCGFFFIYTDV